MAEGFQLRLIPLEVKCGADSLAERQDRHARREHVVYHVRVALELPVRIYGTAIMVVSQFAKRFRHWLWLEG